MLPENPGVRLRGASSSDDIKKRALRICTRLVCMSVDIVFQRQVAKARSSRCGSFPQFAGHRFRRRDIACAPNDQRFQPRSLV